MFIEGFVTPIPTANRANFLDHTKKAVDSFLEFGATRVVDAWGDDVPKGQITDFPGAVQAKADETVGFGWIEYPDRATRDEAAKKVMSDPRMREMGEMPFDGKRMIFAGFESVVDTGPVTKSGYVEGFVSAVPKENKRIFIEHARAAAPLFLKHGALRVVECWGEDVPQGEVTDYYRAVKAEKDEAVIFSWVEWPDKATRESGQVGLYPEMDAHMKGNPMPFDGKRMIFGGFEIINEANRG